ncbi:MAG TPA: TetR/AcrR family transcriptional regulator [Anaeromyxobacter sp.]|nr:TetR/AcrR family transcriptional regulator [Anaeromyxobacter sp.]
MSSPNAREDRRAREIERTRQDILDAAARVFARGGYQAATVQAIAREAGFTAASLYTYFASKDAIFDGLRDEMRRRVLASFDVPMPTGLSLAQSLELLLQRQLALVAERMDALRVFFERPPALEEERNMRATLLERLAAHLEAAATGGELRLPAREAAAVLMGLVHGVVISWVAGEELPDPRRLAGRLVDVFLHGVARPAVP